MKRLLECLRSACKCCPRCKELEKALLESQASTWGWKSRAEIAEKQAKDAKAVRELLATIRKIAESAETPAEAPTETWS